MAAFQAGASCAFAQRLEESGREPGISPKLDRDAAIGSFAVEAPGWPDWQSASVKLEASPPEAGEAGGGGPPGGP